MKPDASPQPVRHPEKTTMILSRPSRTQHCKRDDLTPLERSDRLFRHMIAVPKEAVMKAQARIDKQKKRKSKAG